MFMPLALTFALLAVSADAVGATAPQQPYPVKPVRLVVPFPPGGGSDSVARLFARKMTEATGQTVVVDNRPGAGGTIGAVAGVRAAPDGYTLLLVSGSYGTNAALYTLPYDPVEDIEAIFLVGEIGFAVVVHPSTPFKDIGGLIAFNKAKPEALNYASTGTGGITHLATELFLLSTRTQMTHVPYKGTGAALTSVMSGQVHLVFGSLAATLAQVRANRLRPLAVTTSKRIAMLPNVPTVGESVPGYVAVGWHGFAGPKGLPASVVGFWNKEMNKAMEAEDLKKQWAIDALDPVGGAPDNLVRTIERDVRTWKRVVKEAKIPMLN